MNRQMVLFALMWAAVGCTSNGTESVFLGRGASATVDDCRLERLLVVNSDFTSTIETNLLNLVTGVVTPGPTPTDLDTVPVRVGCRGGLLLRGEAELELMDTAGRVTTTVAMASGEDPYAANPQRVLHLGETRAYAIQQATNRIAVIDPAAAALTAEIDLSAFLVANDTDRSVDASDGIVIGERAFIALGNYWFDDDFMIHFEGSALAVIDTTMDVLVDADPSVDGVQPIALAAENPWRGLEHDMTRSRLLVASAGDAFTLDGGIEAVDLETLEATGLLVSEEDLGGELHAFTLVDERRALILAGRRIVVWDIESGAIDVTIAEDIDGMHRHGPFVITWTAEGEGAGLRAFDASTGVEVTPEGMPLVIGSVPITAVASVP